jgi:glycine betaine/proline transport system substrate-binding protein
VISAAPEVNDTTHQGHSHKYPFVDDQESQLQAPAESREKEATMRKTLIALSIWAIAGLASNQVAQAKETITLAELNWTAAIAIDHVLKRVMEDRLDVEVKLVTADYPVIFASMDKGDGGIDVIPDFWMPNLANYWSVYVEPGSKGSVLVNEKPYLGTQGLYVPGYIQDKHGVRSVEDLKRPEIVTLFDTDGNGKGEYYPGALGNASTDVEIVKAKSYGYDKLYEPVFVDQWALQAKLDAAFKKKEGIVFFYWSPEWIQSAYDLRLLEEPKFDGYAMESKKGDPLYNPNGCWKMITSKEDSEWLAKSHVACAWPSATVYVGYSKALAHRAPKVAQFLKQLSFDTKTVADWILKIDHDKVEPATMALEWVQQHPDAVNNWLAGIQ